MIKKLLVVCALASTLALAACAGGTPAPDPSTPPAPSVTDQTDQVIGQIQQITAQVCNFVPTISTIAAIITAGNSSVVAVTDVAQAICAAVAPKAQVYRRATRRMTAPSAASVPTVDGVPIQGYFLR